MKIRLWQSGEFIGMKSLTEALRLSAGDKRIALVGAGGKTTILFALAEEVRERGKKAIVTTSTHIRRPEHFFITDEDIEGLSAALDGQGIAVVGSGDPGRKLCAAPEKFMAKAAGLADVVFIEADGSRMLPVKAPAAHEPVLRGDEQLVIAVAGMSALGKPIEAVCHRPEQVTAILGRKPSDCLEPGDIAVLLSDPRGGRKLVTARFAAVLNQVDTEEQLREAAVCAAMLEQRLPAGCPVLALGREPV